MERTRTYLVTEHPYYASLLSQMIFSWTKKIPTAGVRLTKQGNVELAVNRDFWNSLSDKHKAGLLMHECLHVSLHHLTRGKDLDKHIANIAMDTALNQYIPADLLPPGALMPNQFQLPPNKAFEVYYTELIKKAQQKKVSKASTLDDHDGFGQSAECDDAGSGDTELPQEIQNEIIDQMIKKAVKDAEASAPGSTPKHIEQALQAMQRAPAKINWRQQLRNLVGHNLSDDREDTRTRVNRRLGFAAAGRKRKGSPRIIVAIDQSGSVSNEMCDQALSELRGILSVMHDKTEVLFFDTAIAKTMKLSDLKGPLPRFAGGGTNFKCVTEYATKSRPDTLIILTDGEDTDPGKQPYPLIWGIIGREGCAEHLIGKKIYVTNDLKNET